MTVIIKEEKRIDAPAKTYLQMYLEHINDYKEYKKRKAVSAAEKPKREPTEV